MKQRSSGLLMHIASLPGPYGIGSFGREAVKFAEFLKSMGFTYWQTLPFGTTDEFHSPYTSYSAFAGNPYFIDLPTLCADGLITSEELKKNEYQKPFVIPYKWLDQTRMPLLRKAYGRMSEQLADSVQKFADEQSWLPDFALYMALKDAHGGKDWIDWEPDLKLRKPNVIKKAAENHAADVLFYEFVQYEFFTQWKSVKKQINEIGIRIIGDMPIYLSLCSADVWANQKLFQLDEKGQPLQCAGCPPDYFSEDGQYWGNPIYDWNAMEKTGYDWWMKRIAVSLELYDMVRIDHFRAFSAYWSIPFGAKTAKEGKWVEGPGMKFFDKVFAAFDDPQIIAEDLGTIDENVVELIRKTGLPGMRVLQFGFVDDGDNLHLPHNIPQNSIAYTGTHDNETLFSFIYGSAPEQRERVLRYCNFSGDWTEGGFHSPVCRAMIRTLWQCPAKIAVLPIQDLCGYGSDTRMNKPGLTDDNWNYRVTEDAISRIDRDWMAKTNQTYHRSSL